jgi:hypothetical protein
MLELESAQLVVSANIRTRRYLAATKSIPPPRTTAHPTANCAQTIDVTEPQKVFAQAASANFLSRPFNVVQPVLKQLIYKMGMTPAAPCLPSSPTPTAS